MNLNKTIGLELKRQMRHSQIDASEKILFLFKNFFIMAVFTLIMLFKNITYLDY